LVSPLSLGIAINIDRVTESLPENPLFGSPPSGHSPSGRREAASVGGFVATTNCLAGKIDKVLDYTASLVFHGAIHAGLFFIVTSVCCESIHEVMRVLPIFAPASYEPIGSVTDRDEWRPAPANGPSVGLYPPPPPPAQRELPKKCGNQQI
jgi:hypothetical protein